MWISHGQRPLSQGVLRHALAVRVGDTQLDYDDLPLAKHIVECCSGLVATDEKGETFRFMHFSI